MSQQSLTDDFKKVWLDARVNSLKVDKDLSRPSINTVQVTSKTTAVSVSNPSGTIQTVSLTDAPQTAFDFDVNLTGYDGGLDIVNVSVNDYSGTFGTNGFPVVSVHTRSSGSFKINVANVHNTNALNGDIVIGYEVIKGF